MKPIKFSESIVILANQSVIFDFTQDYTQRLVWDTFLVKATLIEGAEEAGIGVRAFCVARNGIGMETEYISFNRPKTTAIKMTKRSWIFNTFVGSWNFKMIDQNKTEVTFMYAFTLRFLFRFVSSIAKKNLQKNVRERLRDLKMSFEK